MIPSLHFLFFLLSFLGSLVQAVPYGNYSHGSSGDHHSSGLTREFDLSVTWEDHSPDGYTRKMLLANHQSPGPELRVRQDDWVIVNVHNHSPYNVTIHFHGIEMLGTPWSDGVPGVTQTPIHPGCSFRYKWKATQYGSYWYHAHFRGQIEDGLYGPIIINPRPSDPKPFRFISSDPDTLRAMEEAEEKVVPLAIADFTHVTSEDKWDMTLAAGFEDSCYDSIVFNGKGRVECLPADEVAANLSSDQKTYLGLVPNATMTDKGCLPPSVMIAIGGGKGDASALQPGVFSGCKETEGEVEVIRPSRDDAEWIAIDLIGAINFATGPVSIDGHDMWVYAMDGGYIHPQKVQGVVLTNGDRYSVLVKLGKRGDFKIRFNSMAAPQVIVGHAVLSVGGAAGGYNDAGSDSEPFFSITGVPLSTDTVLFDQSKASPYPAAPIPESADALYQLHMKIDGASYLWALNSSRLMPVDLDADQPILFHPDPYVHDNVTITTKLNDWVDLVFYASVFPQPPHPVHKHGTKMYLIGQGTGPFEWSSVDEAVRDVPDQFNLVDPPRRDAFASLPAADEVTWVVVRYQASNPGAWLLHCHINNHMLGGMMMVIQDGVDAWPTIPEQYQNGRSGL